MKVLLIMKLKKLLPLIGLSIFAYLIYKIGLKNIINTISNANIIYIILAIITAFIVNVIFAIKWREILKAQNIHISISHSYVLYLIGMFYGAITPSRMGSIIRASYLKKETDRSFTDCLSSIAIERIMDLFVIFIFAFIGSLLLSSFINIYFSIILAFFLFIIASYILLKKKDFILKFILKRFRATISNFYNNIPKFRYLIYPLFLTFIVWIINAILVYLVFRSLSLHFNLFYLVCIYSIGTVVALIPITIGGLGTREATLITVFGFFGFSAQQIISISLITLGVGLFPALVGMILSFKYKS